MRPASEIHSAIDLLHAEMDRLLDAIEHHAARNSPSGQQIADAVANMSIAHEVLRWVVGISPGEYDDELMWLRAYLLDDPPKIDDRDPRTN